MSLFPGFWKNSPDLSVKWLELMEKYSEEKRRFQQPIQVYMWGRGGKSDGFLVTKYEKYGMKVGLERLEND